MLRIQSLDKIMDQGHLDDVYKDVRRYGDITSDCDGIETRNISIKHKGRCGALALPSVKCIVQDGSW